MTRKTKIRLAIIIPLLALFSYGAWHGVNTLVVRQLSLFHLIEIGDLEAVEYICEWDRNRIDAMGGNELPDYMKGQTPLLAAMMDERFEIALHLIEVGADVNAKDRRDDETSPLHYAALYGHVESARALINAGADVNGANEISFTPLHLAARNGHIEIVRLLVESGAR